MAIRPNNTDGTGTLETALTQLRGGALRVLWARSLGAHVPIALLVSGTAVLVLRFVADLSRQQAALALLVVVITPFTAWLVARGRIPARPYLIAWLDRRSGGTGRVLTHFDVQDERWSEAAASDFKRMSARAKPQTPDFSPLAWRSLPAGLFACAALWFQPLEASAFPPVALFESMLSGMTERLNDLEDLGLMDDERVEELAERLSNIELRLADGNLEQALESMDRFSKNLSEESSRIAEMLATAREKIESIPSEDLAALAEALQEMAKSFAGSPLAAEAAEKAEALMKGLEGMDLAGMDMSALRGMDLSKFGEMPGALSAELAAKLSEMAQAGFLDQAGLASALARRGKLGNLKDFKFKHAEDCASKAGGL
jgi:hypothetical protein